MRQCLLSIGLLAWIAAACAGEAAPPDQPGAGPGFHSQNGAALAPTVTTGWNATFTDNAGPNSGIRALVVWDDGSGDALYAGGTSSWSGGAMQAAGGLATKYIGRWNGSSWSTLGAGLNGEAYAMVGFEGELIVGGQFSGAGDVVASGVARWNGTRWSAMGTQLRNVNALLVHRGTLVAAGTLRRADGSDVYSVVRWSLDHWAEIGNEFNQPVYTLADYNDTIVAGGNFGYVAQWNDSSWVQLGTGGFASHLIIYQGDLIAASGQSVRRWDGNSWTNLAGLSNQIMALAVYQGELYASGSFPGRLARWNGAEWQTFAGGANYAVRTLYADAGRLYAGGDFTHIGSSPAGYVAHWDGIEWAALGGGINGGVLGLETYESDLIAAGRFTTAGDTAAGYVARWDGARWSAMGTGLPGPASALTIYAGLPAVAGEFQDPGGSIRSRVWVWNGSSWTALGAGMNSGVIRLFGTQNDLIATGLFTFADGMPADNFAYWSNGAWRAMGVSPVRLAFDLAEFNGEIIVAGQSGPASSIARWDGQAWQSFAPAAPDFAYALAIYNGELIAAGGDNVFTSPSYAVRRWNGLNWVPLGDGLGQQVHAMAVYNGDLLASVVDAVTQVARVWRWDGNQWSALDGDFGIYAPEVLREHRGQLIAGGFFSSAGGVVSPFIGAYGPADSTQVAITQTTPFPSVTGQAVEITVEVTAATAPPVGHVTVTGSPGGACTDLSLTPISATSSRASCQIQWDSACTRSLVANYVGATNGASIWQSSESAAFEHSVVGSVPCATSALFANGFE